MSRRASRVLRLVLAGCVDEARSLPWVDDAACRRAIECGLADVLARAIRRGRARSGLSARQTDALRAAADREAALVLATEHEARAVATRLRAAGIPCVALKGLAANARLHRPRGWCRMPGDIDLLVPDDAADEATRLFHEDGAYEAHGHLGPDFYEGHHHTRPFARRGGHAFPVELHRRVSGATTGGIDVDHAGLWERATVCDELGPDLLCLDDVDQCLTTAIHVDRDDAYQGRARQLFDLALALEACRDRKEELADRARAWGAGFTLERALDLLDAFLDRPGRDVGIGRSLWIRFALDAVLAPGNDDALPAWYRQGVFRMVTHAQGPGRLLAALTSPLRRRAAGTRPGD